MPSLPSRTAHSVTHSINFEQRFVELPFTQETGSLTVSITLHEGPNSLAIAQGRPKRVSGNPASSLRSGLFSSG
jgi:hypothetical protein